MHRMMRHVFLCLPVFSGSGWCAGKLSDRFWRGVSLHTYFQSRESCSCRHTSLPHSPETKGNNCLNEIVLVSTMRSVRLSRAHDNSYWSTDSSRKETLQLLAHVSVITRSQLSKVVYISWQFKAKSREISGLIKMCTKSAESTLRWWLAWHNEGK